MHANMTTITFEAKVVSFPKLENSILNYKKQKQGKRGKDKDKHKDKDKDKEGGKDKDNQKCRKSLLEELGIETDDTKEKDNKNNIIANLSKDKKKDNVNNKAVDDKYLQNIFIMTLNNIILRRHADQKLGDFEF